MKPLDVSLIENPGLARPAEAPRRKDGPDFGRELAGALDGVERLQTEADQQAARAALGGGNLHELSIALEKADIAMRVAMKVRNKVVDAYHEIMRMSL